MNPELPFGLPLQPEPEPKPAGPRLADHDARQRIRQDLETNLVVEAAAGTGKTSILVDRIVAVIKAGRAKLGSGADAVRADAQHSDDQGSSPVGSIVAVTFTDPAAGELKLRLRKKIEEERQSGTVTPEEKQRLEAALGQLEEARIGTIHSFCADLLRERPVEAGIDPLFQVAADDNASTLFERAFDRWFEGQLAGPSEGVRRILRRRPTEEGPRGLLRSAARALIERRDFSSPWRPSQGFNRNGAIDGLIAEMDSLAEWAGSGDQTDYFTKSLIEIKRFADEVHRAELISLASGSHGLDAGSVRDDRGDDRPVDDKPGRDYDGIEARLIEFAGARNKHWGWKGFRRTAAEFPKEELQRRRDLLKTRIDFFRDEAGADLAPRLREELWPIVDDYTRLKKSAGFLDFLDLLLSARDLLRHDAQVRRDFQKRFSHVFIDEFQDTDPLQAEILLLLAADDPAATDWRRVRPIPGKLFIVGDPKQSIYRFRRADVSLYEQVKRQIEQSQGALLELSTSFRSVPEIQEAVNAAFARRMDGNAPGRARYVRLNPHRDGAASQPAIVALPVPAPYGDFGKIVEWKIEESLPEAVAAFVEWLVSSSNWKVTERERPEPVDIRPHHVCLLFRRFRSFLTDVTRPYVRALEARRLPHLLVGGTSFYEREEVEALYNALQAIERPDDELSVFATLRGPFFAFNDADLLAFKTTCKTWHPFQKLPDDLSEECKAIGEALTVLRRLNRERNRRPIADTIGRLLAKTRAHAGLAIWEAGEQALANIARLMDLARRAEESRVSSFRAFVEWLRAERERGEASDAPIMEEGSEGVRIMTVHRAKGLEFPVVILADITAREVPSNPSRWVDTDNLLCAFKLAGCMPAELQEHAEEETALELEEAARVLYVAATRARDLLVVPALGDVRRDEGWLKAIYPAIYPAAAQASRPASATPNGCPEFGRESTPDRPDKVERPKDAIVPGLHQPERGNHKVVWWDPSILKLKVEDSIDLSRQTLVHRLLATDDGGNRSQESIRAHETWQKERTRVRTKSRHPSLDVATATELAGDTPIVTAATIASGTPIHTVAELVAGIDVRIESTRAHEPRAISDRPSGKRFGTLVHAILALVDLRGDRSAVEAIAKLQGKLLGATVAEVRAAVEAVVQTLDHGLIRRAAAAQIAGLCRRESPVAIVFEDGLMVEGVVDLTFREDEPGIGSVSSAGASDSCPERAAGAMSVTAGPIWTVVDFKTDVEISEKSEEEYKTQVRLYAQAISRATGQPARAVLLRV